MRDKSTLEIKAMLEKPLRDVLVGGFIDSEAPCVFHPLYEHIYFMTSDKIIEMSIGEDAKIILKFIEKIETWSNIDEDDQFAIMSIYSLLFKTEQEVKVTSIYYQDTLLSELRMEYFDGVIRKNVIFDPRNFFGFSFSSG
jgi:hypothetical protein